MIPIEVIELQNEAVDNLVNILHSKKDFVFKAPTGSGKTHMMADFMSRIIENDADIIFLVSTLSKSGLDIQNEKEFLDYQYNGEFKNLDIHRFEVNEDKSVEKSRINLETNHNVYILGNAKYTKATQLYKYFEAWITNIKALNKKIYLIRDEGHRATNNLKEQEEHFEKVIDFTATPKKKTAVDVEITESEAIRCNLIKMVEYHDRDKEEYNLETALDKLIELKKLYNVYFENKINPCMIIQISNKEKANAELDSIKETLNKKEYNKLKWVLIVGNDKDCDTNDIIKRKGKVNEDELKALAEPDNSSIDIVIFKMVVSEGWNVKRACLLYQERQTESEILTQQVIGRIRRNPVLKNFSDYSEEAKSVFMKAYVYGKAEKDENTVFVKIPAEIKEEINNNVKICTTVLKLKGDKKVDITEVVKDAITPNPVIPTSDIFSLYKTYSRLNSDLKTELIPKLQNFKDWVWGINNISKIKSVYNSVLSDYKNTIDFDKDATGNKKYVSFPDLSSLSITIFNDSVKNWVWERSDTDGEIEKHKFYFDSDAEKTWVEEMKNIATIKNGYYWGKNFIPNSEIKFQYFNDGIHTSYPDFVLKDNKSRIHIIEVKSFLKSNNQVVDENEYQKKVEALIEGYKWISLLTGYIFYIPKLVSNKNNTDSHWEITRIMRNEKYQIDDNNWKNLVNEYEIDELIDFNPALKLSEFQDFLQ